MKNYFSTHDIQNIQELINQALELKKKQYQPGTWKGKNPWIVIF